MDYQKIYDNLVSKAKTRLDSKVYTESHHIIPKCLGGSDDSTNLVELTPEEHYVAHQLLIKIYPKNIALVYAAQMMCTGRPNNKMYGWIRRRYVSICRARTGKKNPSYGTMWICDPKNKVNRKISSGEDIPKGWIKGRNIWNKKPKLSSEQLLKSRQEGARKRWKLHPKMSDASRRKMAISKIGNRSLSGRIWITDGRLNRVVEKNSQIPSGWARGKTLRRHDEEVSYGSSKADS